jgi:chemotaxis protein CheX
MGAEKLDTSKTDTDKAVDLFTVKMPDLAFKPASKDLEPLLKGALEQPIEVVVFDFSLVRAIEPTLLNLIFRFQMDVKKANKRLFTIAVASSLHMQFKERGIDKAFCIFSSVDEVQKELKAFKAPKIDAEILKTFVKGAMVTFEGQLKTKLTPGKMTTKSQVYESGDAIVGRMMVRVPGFEGQVSICFSEAVFKKAYKKLLDEDIEKIDSSNSDAAGELMNIIYGQAKTILNQNRNMALPAILPEVVLAPKAEPTKGLVLCMPFTSEIGDVRLEILFGA